MSVLCPQLRQCEDRRVADAEQRVAVLTQLKALNNNVSALWEEMRVNRGDIKGIYFKIGMISGGTAMITTLLINFITKAH